MRSVALPPQEDRCQANAKHQPASKARQHCPLDPPPDGFCAGTSTKNIHTPAWQQRRTRDLAMYEPKGGGGSKQPAGRKQQSKTSQRVGTKERPLASSFSPAVQDCVQRSGVNPRKQPPSVHQTKVDSEGQGNPIKNAETRAQHDSHKTAEATTAVQLRGTQT